MTLPIPLSTIRNVLGYLQCEISMLQNHLNIIDNSLSQSEKSNAELEVIKSAKNIGKIIKTIEDRTNWKIPISGYTNTELSEKGII